MRIAGIGSDWRFGLAVLSSVLSLSARGTAADADASAAAPQPDTRIDDVRVLSASARSLLLEYTPRYTHTDTLQIGQQTYVRLNFSGASTPGRTAEQAGAPDLRHRYLPLAFPASGSHRVTLVSADYETVRDLNLLPIPKFRVAEDMVEVSGYTPDPGQYGRAGLRPETPVELVQPSQVRSLLIGGVKLWPVQYDPASRTVRRCSRMVIEVEFAAGSSSPVDEQDIRLLGGAVVNARMLSAFPRRAPVVAKVAAAPSVLASGDWYRIPVTEEGIYKIDAAYLATAGIAVANLDPRTIRIYGNGGQELSEDISASRPVDLVENAIYVEGESDGQFGTSDYVLFYGRSPRGWKYDGVARTWRHYINHYTETNYYWLTFGGAQGKRMADQPSSDAPATVVVEKFTDGVFIEEEKSNKLSSGKDWYGQSLSGPSSSFTHVNVLPGLVPNETILYRYTLVASDETFPRFTVRDGSTTLGSHALPPSSTGAYLYATAGTFEATGTSSLSANTSQFQVAFASNSSAGEGWIDWVEILYPRMLWGVNNSLRFRTPDADGIAEYRLQQFTSRPMVFQVTDPLNVRLVSGVSGSYAFRDTLRSGRVAEYWATSVGAWKTPAAAQKMANQNLRGYGGGADFIILTSSEYLAPAERLKAFREKPENGGLKTVVTDVASVYNEFGGGLPDITAIRDYLKYAYDTWSPRPTFVLMFGGASYDYKGLLGTKSSYVPTWQSAESRHDINSYATDDYFAKFGQGDAPSLVLGRISARTLGEANTVVDKIIRYDAESVDDGWKMRMLYIGDDSWTTDGGEYSDGTMHSDDAETLSSPFYTPDEFEKNKIHIAEYPTVFSAQGRRKPGAAQGIIDQVNKGVLVLNYSGHGNPKVWAHESIFEVTTSIPAMTNRNRLALFILATCNFSQFDSPQSYTGSELLLNKSDGGAIGVISASRKVYAAGNAELNQGTYRWLFSRDSYNRVLVERPATALFTYKATGSNNDNDQKFLYMGDPTTRLAYPQGYAVIDSINGEPVDSVDGARRQQPITLKALSRVTVSGSVRDASNRTNTGYNGVLQLHVNDVSRQQLIVNFYPGRNWSYSSTGGTIYRGENSVTNGSFRATFVVPKDISYADTTGRGRIVGYFSDGSSDGAGYTGMMRIGGTDSSAANDGEGPTMRIYLDSRSFRPGDVVGQQPTLIVDMRDSSGVNTSTAGIGHRIEAWINNSVQSKDLTEYYTSTRDDFREGAVQYPLTGLQTGRNTIRVRAWDSYNNSSVTETFFEVASSDRLSISDVFNYPNPFSGETLFTFRQNLSAPLDVEVKVYTLAGRLIQSLQTIAAGEPMVRIPWDGRDRDGDLLANGVYLYKLVVRTTDGTFASEALGKLTVLR